MKQKSQRNAGFSLIEVMFAMVFLTVVIFGVLRLQTSNLVLTNTQQNQLKAHFYTTQALEIAQGLGMDAFKACDQGCHLIQGGESYELKMNGVEKLEDDLFERAFLIEDSLGSAMLLVSQVSWIDSSGEHKVEAKRVVF